MADPSSVVILVSGQPVTPFARVGQLRIDDLVNDAPNTAALTFVYEPRMGPAVSGAFDLGAFDLGAFDHATRPPALIAPPPIEPGAPIQIYLGTVTPDALIFGGQITTREQFAEFDQPQHRRFHVTCIDYTRRLNRRKVVKDYGAASATAIVLDVIATFAPTITTAHVMPGLATVTGGIVFTFEEVSRALSRIAEQIGAYWYVDYTGDLHFFTGTEAGPDPMAIIPGADFANFKITADLTQVRTRVIVEGDGAAVLTTIPAGDAILPIAASGAFNPAGGLARVGTTRVSYTGVHAGGVEINTVGVGSGGTAPPAAPGAPSAAVASGVAGKLAGGPYRYAVTVELSDGSRSDVGALSGSVTISAAAVPATTGAALPTPPIKGPIAVGVASRYATSFVDAAGSETPATTGGNTVTGRAVDPPADAGNPNNATGGAMAAGSYWYRTSFLTPAGETLTGAGAGSIDAITLTAPSNAVDLSFLPLSADGRVTGRRIYRSSMGPNLSAPVLPWRHVVDIPNNTSTTYKDTTADTDLPARPLPAFTSATDAGEGATVTIPTSTDPRVTRRRLYRQDSAGQYRLIAEIPDNTTTSYNDVIASAGGGALAPTVNGINTGAINLTAIPLGPAGTVRRRVFRTTAGGSQLRELTVLSNNTTTTHTDTESDQTLGGSPLPAQGGAGAGAPPTPAGSTTIRVSSLAGLPSAGWVIVEEQVIRYSGTSAAGGEFLTGIPASGTGAITADIPAGTVVKSAPALVGQSPVVAPVTLGDGVQLIAQVDDLPAQAAVAAIEGGDGVIEHYIQDRRLSETAATARGRAELELFKAVELILSYVTHDPNTRSGRTVHVDLPAPTSVTGDFLIQKVTIDDVAVWKHTTPRRTVSASTTRFSFDDVLNRISLSRLSTTEHV